MTNKLLRNGSKGQEVKTLQENLRKLGYTVDVDGEFGPKTDEAVKSLQTLFGYDVDGLVGEGTQALITAQMGHGWNLSLPNAKELAMRSQGGGKAGTDAAGGKPGMAQAQGGKPGADAAQGGKPGMAQAQGGKPGMDAAGGKPGAQQGGGKPGAQQGGGKPGAGAPSGKPTDNGGMKK